MSDVRGTEAPADGHPTPPARQAVTAFSIAETVKSGLLWTTACIEQAAMREGLARQGALDVAESLLVMVAGEVLGGHRLTGDAAWHEALRAMDKARVMIRSGVPQEAPYHITRALCVVAGLGQRAAERLRDLQLL